MSYSSLARQVADTALMERVNAAAQQEAIENPGVHDSPFAQAIRGNYASPVQVLAWPVCAATEAAYEFALNSGNPNPGGDPAVITDADILSAVQANWPTEWPPPAPTPPTNPPVVS